MAVETVKDLKNKPLVEALLEVRWQLEGAPGMVSDPYYQLLIGRLYDRVQDRFPAWIKLPVAEVPEYMAPFTPQHQFRIQPDTWPLLQLGPGILTVNDTEGYLWDDFKGLCQYAVEALFASYPESSERLKLFEVSLRYIDADTLDGVSALDFLSKLKLDLTIPDKLFAGGRVEAQPLGVGVNLVFPTVAPKGAIQLRFGQGKKKDADALVWETQLISRGEDAPSTPEALLDWLEEAHKITHDWFVKLIEGELMEKYR